jgi:hypothetical protein
MPGRFGRQFSHRLDRGSLFPPHSGHMLLLLMTTSIVTSGRPASTNSGKNTTTTRVMPIVTDRWQDELDVFVIGSLGFAREYDQDGNIRVIHVRILAPHHGIGRGRPFVASGATPKCGTLAAYKDGCRCSECQAAKKASRKDRRPCARLRAA